MLVSHTGVSGSYDSPRNLSDGQLDRIAARGGLVGIAFFKEAVGGETLAHVVRAIRYTIDQIGDEHVAIGSDFDGVVRAPFDSAGFGSLSQALLESGLSPDAVQRVMGRNALRFLSQNLPDDTVQM
jgi:microsomal dipeptidase-like Zn-dependent dipeptidase